MNYSKLTLEHFNRAGTAGVLTGDGVARASAGSVAQGTWVQFDLRAKRRSFASALILEARFLAFGCPHTIAVADWLASHAAGRTAEPSLPEPVVALQQLFGVPMEKLGRLFVVEDAWVGAVQALLNLREKA
jgi:NifU-like N terminal domain